MSYKPRRRDTLLIPSGSHGNPDALHLYVVLTDICAGGMHLLGSISSIRSGQFHDPTCKIAAGEHQFIKQESFVRYDRFDTFRADRIVKCVNGWVYRRHSEITEELWRRICGGIGISPHTPRRIIKYWQENGS